MAIANYVATATPSAGGEQVTGYVVYNGTDAYIIPQEGTTFALDSGVLTVTQANAVQVDPDTVKLTSLNLETRTITELAANAGTITPSEGYDGIGSITISSVKLETPAAFTPVQASTAGTSSIAKTDDSAWGLTGITVNNVLVQTKAATLSEGEGSTVEPDDGYLLSSVTVPGITVYSPEAVTPGASAQTIEQEGSYMKQVTVNAVPLDEAFDGNFTPTTAEQTRSVAANKYFNGTVTVGAIQLDTGVTTVKSNSTADQTIEAEEGKYIKTFTVQKINVQANKTVAPAEAETPVTPDDTYDYLAQVTVGAIQVETKTVKSNLTEDQTVDATAGKYIKQVTVQKLNAQAKTVEELTTQTGAITADSTYDVLSSVTIEGVKLDTPAVFTPEEAENVAVVGEAIVDESRVGGADASTYSVISKTSEDAWGITEAKVNKITTEDVSVKSTTEEQTVPATEGKYIKNVTVQKLNVQERTATPADTAADITPEEGYDYLSKVSVGAVPIATGNSATPKLDQQVINAENGYWKSFTVAATPLQAAGTVTPTETQQDAPALSEGNIGYSTFKVGAIPVYTPEAVTPNDSVQEIKQDGSYMKLVTVNAVPTETGTVKSNLTKSQTVTPTAGKYFNSVTVENLVPQEVSVTPAEEAKEITPEGGYDVISKVTVGAISVETKAAVTPTKESQTVNATEGSYFKSLTVNGYVPVLQEKTVDPEEASQNVTADAEYDGLSKVIVNPIQTESKEVTATKSEQVITPAEGKYLKEVTISGYVPNVHPVEVDELTVGQTITTEEGYDGISQVTINGVKLQNKTVNGSKTQQVVEKDDGTAWGLGTVTVEGYTPNLETRTLAELTTETGAITPNEGYDGIGSLTVESVRLQNVSVDPTTEGTTAEKTDDTAWGFGTVTVNAPMLDEAVTITPSEEQQVKVPEGLGFKGVIVKGIQLDTTNNSADPKTTEETYSAEGGKYFKQFSVGAVDVLESPTVEPSETEQPYVAEEGKFYQGFTVKAIGIDSATNTATPSLEEQTLTPESGKYYKKFTVQATPLAEAQTFTPNDESQTAVLGEGNIGIKGATVNAVPVDSATNSYTPTAEGATVNATEGQYYKSFTVAPVPTEQKTVVPADEDQVVTPTEGKFFDKVTVKADIDAPLQTKTVTPTTAQQVVTPDEGYGGLSSVTVVAAPLDEEITVQSSIEDQTKTPTGLGFKSVKVTGDADLIAENIKKGVDILGVTGTLEAGGNPGEYEAGFNADEWVALDLPESVTSQAWFRAAPYYQGHYLGKTFDGGNYMSVVVYSRYGKALTTVMLNDLIGKLYVEKVDIDNPFPTAGGTLTLTETVDSSEVDWSTTESVAGNGNAIVVSQPLAIGSRLKMDSVELTSETAVDLFTTDALQASVELTDCHLKGVMVATPTGGTLRVSNCSIEDAGTKSRSTGDGFLLTLSGSSEVERTKVQGANGANVIGGRVILRANTFATTESAVTVSANPEKLSLEGNIFNVTSGDELKIADSVTDMSGASVIGSLEITGSWKISGSSIVPTEGTPTPEPEPEVTATDKAVEFFNELSQDAISSYMVSNKDAVMTALGVTESSSVTDIGTLLYDKLQGGDTISINMNDGGVLNISGHFYEPTDDLPYWDMSIEYVVPEGGTNKCFPEGSKMSVKGGKVLIHVTNGEMTSYGDYNLVLLVYGYAVTITDVTVVDEEGEFVLDVSNLTRENDFSNPCIIDPDSSTWEIYVRQFYLPPADAQGTVSVDDEEVQWSEVHGQINY